MFKKLAIFPVFFFISLSAHADGLDFSLSNESARFVYLFDSPVQIGIGGTEMGFGISYNDNKDYLFDFRFLVSGNVLGSNRSLQLSVGGKAYVGELDDVKDGTLASIGIGGRVNYVIPSAMPMSAYIEGFFAPDITSFGDNKNLTEIGVGYEIEIAPTTRVYVGYRQIETKLEDTGLKFKTDDEAHVGLRVSF